VKKPKSDILPAFCFLLPNFAGFLVFMLGPIVLSLFMAFSNWSLRPSVDLAFTGPQNFMDLLGVQHRIGAEGGGLTLALFGAGALLIGAGMLGLFFSMAGGWRGVRWGGVLVAFTGAALGLTALAGGGNHIYFILAALYLLIGWSGTRNAEDEWAFGRGLVPPALLITGILLIWQLNDGMWRVWEPRDARFWQFLYNTLYMMMGIPFSIGGALLFALLLNQRLPTGGLSRRLPGVLLCLILGGLTFGIVARSGMADMGLPGAVLWGVAALGILFNVVGFRTMFYLPKFTAGVALMILWKAMYNPETGPINAALGAAGSWIGLDIEGPRWLASVVWAKPALILMSVWFAIGGTNMLLYLAGLSNVPRDLIDAAEVDGAGVWARFRHVIWPQLAPTTFFIAIMSVIGGLQGGFEQARVMTNGGPAGATTTLSYYIYNKAFQDLDLGYAAAISWILFAFIFGATALNWRFGRDLEVD
jgi:multiple sugar transport system permease protein